MTYRLLSLSLSFAAAFASTALRAEEGEFVPLFDGKTLTGWEQHSGTAEYRVENGVIIGKTVPNTGNSFLCTARKYGNFIVELEFKVAPGMNSGIQFRSNYYEKETEVEINGKKKKFPADRVHGYQFEIDPSPRAFTGGVYDEGRRGWLFDLKNNEAARKAFKQDDWNTARIECRGSSIKTFINGVLAADFTDDLTKEGVIALQVHGIGKKTEAVGKEVMWRNIRIQELK
ncbi:MAG: 3-keto-disaccharide hydrolase [Prosthecobacter sp.]